MRISRCRRRGHAHGAGRGAAKARTGRACGEENGLRRASMDCFDAGARLLRLADLGRRRSLPRWPRWRVQCRGHTRNDTRSRSHRATARRCCVSSRAGVGRRGFEDARSSSRTGLWRSARPISSSSCSPSSSRSSRGCQTRQTLAGGRARHVSVADHQRGVPHRNAGCACAELAPHPACSSHSRDSRPSGPPHLWLMFGRDSRGHVVTGPCPSRLSGARGPHLR